MVGQGHVTGLTGLPRSLQPFGGHDVDKVSCCDGCVLGSPAGGHSHRGRAKRRVPRPRVYFGRPTSWLGRHFGTVSQSDAVRFVSSCCCHCLDVAAPSGFPDLPAAAAVGPASPLGSNDDPFGSAGLCVNEPISDRLIRRCGADR